MTAPFSRFACFVPIPGTETVGLDGLTRSTCRWPFDGNETRYCGHAVMRGVYCAGHVDLAYTAPTPPAERKRLLASLVNGRRAIARVA